MLRMTVNTEEYIQIGDDIRIVFLGGSRNHTRVMLDVQACFQFPESGRRKCEDCCNDSGFQLPECIHQGSPAEIGRAHV